MHNINRRNIYVFVLFLLLLLVSIGGLLHFGLPWTHDGQDHVARVANFYTNLQHGVFIPRWAPNLNWGYGHPILEFLYPLPSYLGSFFHVLGFSFINSVKIVFGLSVVLSGIFMYWWLADFLGFWPGIVGGLLYVYAPYRFVELYVRGEYGELMAFMIIPLVLFFAYRLFRFRSFLYCVGFSISLGCLVLAHNSMALIFLPFILFYGFYLWLLSDQRKRFVCLFVMGFVLGFGLAAFFWIPGLLDGKYTLRDIILGHGEYKRFFLSSFGSLFWGPWQYGGSGGDMFTVQLGFFQWFAFLLSPLLFLKAYRAKNLFALFVCGLIIYTIISIYLMFPVSDLIWSHVRLLQLFQFPWRFLAVPVFTAPVLLAILVKSVPKRQIVLVSLSLMGLMLLFNLFYLHPKGYLYKPDDFFSGVYNGTTDTGESAPMWSVRFMEHRPLSSIEIIEGKAQIVEQKRTPIEHEYIITAMSDVRLVENTLYFPGWFVLVDGKQVTVEFQDPKYRGLMTFMVTPGKHIVDVKFAETRFRKIVDGISVLSLLIVLGVLGYFLKKKKI